MLRALVYPLLLVLLVGCIGESQIRTRTETVEVRVPVPVRQAPPEELSAAPSIRLPRFVPPTHPDASSALTPDGEDALRALIGELVARDRAWRTWADPNTPTDRGHDDR